MQLLRLVGRVGEGVSELRTFLDLIHIIELFVLTGLLRMRFCISHPLEVNVDTL